MEYGLIGSVLGHSFSKPIHEAVGGYTYELHPLPTEEEARTFLESRNFKAINVTIPYKQLVIPYCDTVDPLAEKIGAVNTVVNRGGKLYGYNTDYAGFSYLAAHHGIRFRGRTVLILGSGGTHNTVSAVCADSGAVNILTASRSGKNGTLTYAQAAAHKEVDVLINTTPVGMYPRNGDCAVDLDAFPRLKAVLDVVYNPFCTELVLCARERGIPAFGGLEMLVAQAVYASEHFTGKLLDEKVVIRKTFLDLQAQLANVSLIGMPGSGKTTIGRGLAKALGKQFVDLDEVIEQKAGCTIPDIFARDGEAAFRAIEAQAAAEVGRGSGQVIACGGGIIKTPGNVHALRQNGPVLWIQRPVNRLATAGRPLSKGREALLEMEKERFPLYERAADLIVENTAAFDAAVQTALEKTKEYFEGK